MCAFIDTFFTSRYVRTVDLATRNLNTHFLTSVGPFLTRILVLRRSHNAELIGLLEECTFIIQSACRYVRYNVALHWLEIGQPWSVSWGGGAWSYIVGESKWPWQDKWVCPYKCCSVVRVCVLDLIFKDICVPGSVSLSEYFGRSTSTKELKLSGTIPVERCSLVWSFHNFKVELKYTYNRNWDSCHFIPVYSQHVSAPTIQYHLHFSKYYQCCNRSVALIFTYWCVI
jgi:hypothetical protein